MQHYLMSALKATLKFFGGLGQALIEARARQAALQLANQLKDNPDFKHWTMHEIYERILDKNNPVTLDKKPVME